MAAADRDKWNARYRAAEHAGRAPHAWLASIAGELPRAGAALDIAGGAGRHASWLAARGLDVTLTDISEVALAIAQGRAREDGLALDVIELDLEIEPLPPGPFALVVCVSYLQRALFAAIADSLAPGGMLAFVQPTVKNLERHARPSRTFLLELGEAEAIIRGAGLTIVVNDESWLDDAHEARLLAKK